MFFSFVCASSFLKILSSVTLTPSFSFKGTTTHRYIEQSPYYPQIGYYGFGQVMINNHLLLHDSKKLRAFFNRTFDEVYATKEREMKVIRERIDRIRYIDTELRTMFNRHVPYIPADPVWHWQVNVSYFVR